MTAQVITPENHVEFIQTGKVADFKPPEAAKEAPPEAKPDASATAAPAGETKVEPTKPSEPARDEQGKFKKAENDSAVKSDDDDDPVLTEKIRKIIGKKHRELREAQEFATGEGRRALQAERRAAELEREIAALRSGKSDGPKPGEESGDPDEPKPGDFKTVGEYTRALVKYEAKKAGEQGKAKADSERQQSEAQTAIAAYVERQDAFRQATPDYDEVVGGADIEMHPAAMQYLVESEEGPRLAYHLAKNPGEITRLNRLSPSRLLAELGKLEAKLEAHKPTTEKVETKAAPQVSKAPAPIQTLEGKAATVTKDPSQMNFQELREYRRQEAMKRASAGR